MTLEDLKIMSACHAKGIKIYPVPDGMGTYKKPADCYIEVNIRGSKKRGKQTYPQNEKLYNKIIELYHHFYFRD